MVLLCSRVVVCLGLLLSLVSRGCSWRYGCTLFNSLCSPVEQCDYTVPLGRCTQVDEKRALSAVEHKPLPLSSATGLISTDPVSYDSLRQYRRVRTRIALRSSDSEATQEHRLKRETRKAAGNGNKYIYIVFDLKGCESCVDKMTDGAAHDFTVKLANHMKMPHSQFLEISGSGSIVTFRVGHTEHDLQPDDVAQQISASKSDIEQVTGLVIMEVGTTDKQSNEMARESKTKHAIDEIIALFTYICISVILVLIAISILVVLIKKRNSGKRRYFPSTVYVFRPDGTNHYEELCRSRYQDLDKSQLGLPTTSQEKSNVTKLHTGPPSHWNEEPPKGHMDVTIGHLVLSYLEEHQTNKDKISQEWQELCDYQPESCSVDVASRPENREKNRYQDILTYDHTRVKLDISNNSGNSDYINATHVYDDNPWKPLYVASQGPLAATVCDFWQMVWETNCTSIVMLTECISVGLPQCHQYWPEDGSATYHIYEVHHTSEHSLFREYVVRDFYLKNVKTKESRTVTQFQFVSWPSLGVPQHPTPLLEFRRRVKKSFTGQDSPIIVHDSGGVGRTGTYILIDMVLRRIEKTGSKMKQIDLAATVEHLRDQRMQMVKTKDQFEFALKALAEEVQAILRAMPSVGKTNGKLVDSE